MTRRREIARLSYLSLPRDLQRCHARRAMGSARADPITIKPATAADAEAIGRLIERTLRESNAPDYPPQAIEALVAVFSPERIAERLADRDVYVASAGGHVIGTATLHGAVVRAVFVDPGHQNRGLGAKLMDTVENLAKLRSIGVVTVNASLTALGFYEKRGYVALGERQLVDGDRIIVMEKRFAAPDRGAGS
jgi:GNAT superfamily N-acetyltransferase